MITAIYAGLLAFMAAGLFLNVVRLRMKYKVGMGHGKEAALVKAIRAHGNFMETVPFVVIMMAMLESMAMEAVLLHVFGGLLVLSRLLHCWGLYQSTGTSAGRFLGGIIVVTLFVAGGVLLLLGALAY